MSEIGTSCGPLRSATINSIAINVNSFIPLYPIAKGRNPIGRNNIQTENEAIFNKAIAEFDIEIVIGKDLNPDNVKAMD